MNEFDKFMDGLSQNNPSDILNQKVEEPVETPVIPAKEGEGDEPKKNRRHRRLEQQLEEERAANIVLNRQLAEKNTQVPTIDTEMPQEWVELYGDTPEAKKAWELNVKYLDKITTQAEERALQKFENRQKEEAEAQRKVDDYIISELEGLEDDFGVDFTSDTPAAKKEKKAFLKEIQRISPKDEEGNIIAFADFNATYEMFIAKKAKTTPEPSRQKDLATRTMTTPGQTTPAPKQPTSGWNGWRRDLGL